MPCHNPCVRTECTCSRRNSVHAGARMATWCMGVCVNPSKCTCAMPCVRVAMYLRARYVCATGVLLPPYNLLGINTWILGCAACRVLVCAHTCVCVVSLSAKGMMECCSSMPIKCVLGSGHFSPVMFDRQQVASVIVHREPASQITHNGVGAT